jgi:hypothetical protein
MSCSYLERLVDLTAQLRPLLRPPSEDPPLGPPRCSTARCEDRPVSPARLCLQPTVASPLPPEDDPLPTMSAVLRGGTDPILAPTRPTTLSSRAREELVATLPAAVQSALNNQYGKACTHLSFTADYRFRHVLPPLLQGGFLGTDELSALSVADPLVPVFLALSREFAALDCSSLPGFSSYRDFATETSVNPIRVQLTSAALFRAGFSVPKLVRWLGGPHVGAHRDVRAIIRKLRPGVEPAVLADLARVFRVGAPARCHAHSSEDNFQAFRRYGNHQSATLNPDKLMRVFEKDVRRGFALALDVRLLPFIRDLHLTPIGIVDIDNPWKSERPVFDSSFHPSLDSMAINDWTHKSWEPQVRFPGSFGRLLRWIWNLRITYPAQKILIGDNDITGAFRLIKYNPELVPMHGYRVGPYLGFATGQTFGDCASPGNFEVAAIARQQQAIYLWAHCVDEVFARAAPYIARMHVPPEATSTEASSFARAVPDPLNTGVLHPDGTRRPPPFPHQVDDCMFADVIPFIRQTSAASIVALEDVFGPKHPQQEFVLSQEKLELAYDESRLVVGHVPNTRRMVVELSPRRRQKLLMFIHSEGWLLPRKRARITEIASLVGMVDSAASYFPWARAQLLALQSLLRRCIVRAHRAARASSRLRRAVDDLRRTLPQELSYRFDSLRCREIAAFVWRNRYSVLICDDSRRAVRTLYKYLHSREPWEQLIGHIIDRSPSIEGASDASHDAIGVALPSLRLWCILPLGPALQARTKLPPDHPDHLQINSLEFLGVLLTFVVALTKVLSAPEDFPPAPTLRCLCDNTSAVAWINKFSTASPVGQNLIRLYAEFIRCSPLGLSAAHIAGALNVVPDCISRPCLLFSPPLTSPCDRRFSDLVQAVCQARSELGSWGLFLPSPELLSCLRSTLSSGASKGRPSLPVTYGHFVASASTLYGSSTTKASLGNFFL